MKKITFIGDGKTKDFYFSFPYFTKNDVVVELNGAPTTGFGLYCVSNGLNADIPFSGGRVCFTKPPKVASVISIHRKLELNRHVDYQPTKPINTMVLNQDMNFMMEVLRDIKTDMQDFADKYSDITGKESTQTVLKRIDIVMAAIDNVSQEIDEFGDISSVHSSIKELKDSVVKLKQTLESVNTNIEGLSSFRNGVLDYVVEMQTPNADNNYTWYRKYVSGWVEQGGVLGSLNNSRITISLPVEMANTKYITLAAGINASTASDFAVAVINPTTTSVTIGTNANYGAGSIWYVCGMSA